VKAVHFVDQIAFRCWQQDVLRLLGLQWSVWVCLVAVCAVFGLECALNAALAGAAIAIPNTALGAWMGVRLWLGRVDALGVLVGAVIKTLLSVVFIGAAFTALQAIGCSSKVRETRD
jgi:F0F1-type ATP synthase assembly protein I